MEGQLTEIQGSKSERLQRKVPNLKSLRDMIKRNSQQQPGSTGGINHSPKI